jgi:glucose/arabinose dehydrogenase
MEFLNSTSTRAKQTLLLLALAALPAAAQFDYSGCDPVKASDFTVVPLLTNSTDSDTREPIMMALNTSPQGNVDIYFTQRYGKVRRYNGDTKTVTTLVDFNYGTDSITAGNSEGLIGIALDPAFSDNGWIYLFIGLRGTWRISRFTLVGNQISRASEKTILRLSVGSSRKHVAGALRFDWDGNLWATVADNESQFTAANTSTLLGKIIRIKPKPFPDNQSPAPGVGSTYDVPAGNLFPPGTADALPEIYVMGVRNPYSIALDPVRKGVAWGDVGPDNFSGSTTNPAQFTEEHNFTTKPGNFGWPYWAGKNIQLESGGGTPASPTYNRGDGGLRSLPPAIPAINPFARACAITGPVYYFDSSNPSTIKFPPHFNGAWFVSDLNRSWVDALALNPAGTEVLGNLRIIGYNSGQLNNPMAMEFGADGALYVVNYHGYRTVGARTGLMRIEYRGNCRVPVSSRPLVKRGVGVEVVGAVVRIGFEGRSIAEVRDPSGRLAWRGESSGPISRDLGPILKPGLHILTVTHSSGRFIAKIVR